MESYDLCDIWRLRNQNVKRFTWRQRTPPIQQRLDYVFVSNDFQESVAKVDVLAAVASDHSAIRLILSVSKELIPGPSYWKFNNLMNCCSCLRISFKMVFMLGICREKYLYHRNLKLYDNKLWSKRR